VSFSNQNVEEVNSCLEHGSRVTASIGSAKLASDGDNFGKELQCTADSSKAFMHPQCSDPSSPSVLQDNIDTDAQKFASLQTLSVGRVDVHGSTGITPSTSHTKEKDKKRSKEKKRKRDGHKKHRDDPEYIERKRLKKEKKQKEKELAKLLADGVKVPGKEEERSIKPSTLQVKPNDSSGLKVATTNVEIKPKPEPSEGSSAPKFRIKIKSRTLNNL